MNVDEVVAAMCLLCHDPVDQRTRAALHIFQRTRKANDQFTHSDLVQLFSSGVLMFGIDNSFDIGTEEEEEEEEDMRIHVRQFTALCMYVVAYDHLECCGTCRCHL